MKKSHRAALTILSVLILLSVATYSAQAQAGKGLLDPNVATEAELQSLPNMTPAIAKDLIAKRPFASVLDLNAFLLAEKLTPAQATEFYRKAFVQINLNTGTPEEFMLVPGSGKRMSIEFAEYRPWKVWLQFDKEIGKYVGQQETDRFKQYMFIPINLNTAADDVLLTVPGMNPAMLQALKKSRPWKSQEQFTMEIGKTAGPKEAARLSRYFVIQ
jgi:DNA uptake protein ComE-like DNA-binding protein